MRRAVMRNVPVLLGMEILVVATGCKELPKPEPFKPYEEIPIHTDENGYLHAEKDGEILLKGRWYSYASKDSKIDPKPFYSVKPKSESKPVKICAKGIVAKVKDNDFKLYYGAGIGFHLCYSDDEDVPLEFSYTLGECPFFPGSHKRLAGFVFDLERKTNASLVPEFRVMFDEWRREENAYVAREESGSYEVRALFKDSGFTYPASDESKTDVKQVQAVNFQMASVDKSSLGFDFCISNLRALLYPDPDTDIDTVSIWKGEAPDAGPNCSPEHYRDAGLEWIDIDGALSVLKKEVTAAQYDVCKEAKCCSATGDWDICTLDNVEEVVRKDAPVNCVTWYDARNFCRWAKGRLPSETEWELAARIDQGDYPWGNDPPTCDYAVMMNDSGEGCEDTYLQPAKVCSRSEGGNTSDGVCDMAGNVWEWVDGWYPANESANIPEKTFRIIKGGSYRSRENALKSKARSMEHPLVPRDMGRVGFRCVR